MQSAGMVALISLWNPWGVQQSAWGVIDQVRGAFLGACHGDSFGKSCKVLREFASHSWGIPGRLPCGMLGKRLQNPEVAWGKSWGHSWAYAGNLFGNVSASSQVSH